MARSKYRVVQQSFTIRPDQLAWLDDRAQRGHELTMSSIIRLIIDSAMEAEQREQRQRGKQSQPELQEVE